MQEQAESKTLDTQYRCYQSISHCRIQRQILVRRFVAHTPKTRVLKGRTLDRPAYDPVFGGACHEAP